MSYLYTNETVERDLTMGNLYDIVDPVIMWDDTIKYYPYVVQREEAMRMDLVCYSIYGNFNYIDELLTLNHILNPWSIKEGDIIYFAEEDDINSLQMQAKTDQNRIVRSLVNPSKDTKKDPNRDEGTGLTPTIKPTNLKEVDIDFNSKKIKIMDRLK
jgi:hypothetical protein